MDDVSIDELKKQHIDSYKTAITDNIINNTSVLVDEDIMSLIRKPPLDSMDLIRVKFLDLAKKNGIVINIDVLSKLLDNYRDNLSKCCVELKDIRIKELKSIADSFPLDSGNTIIKFNKKDFVNLNKTIKKIIKDYLISSYNDCVLNKVNSIFIGDVDSNVKDNIINNVTKYIKGSYQKQLLENLDIKVLVKDTTLINVVKEQSDRYLFTMNNSRIFN